LPRKTDEPIEITEHLAELRSRIIRSLAYAIVGFIAAWIFFKPIYTLLTRPISVAISKLGTKFLMTGITEPLMFRIQVCAIAGLAFAAPLITMELWGFVSPALKPNERKPILWIAPLSIFLFLSGLTATYFILPKTLSYMVGFLPPDAELRPSVTQSIIFIVKMFLAFGLLFELPVVLLFLGKVGIINSRTLISYWRQAVVIIAFLAAVLTPSGDFFTMMVMAVPVIVLYVLSIFLVRMVEERDIPPEPEPEEEE